MAIDRGDVEGDHGPCQFCQRPATFFYASYSVCEEHFMQVTTELMNREGNKGDTDGADQDQ